MALESPVVYVEDLVKTNPVGGDPKSEGDDHLRNIKTALQGSFPYTSPSSATLRTAANNAATCTGTNTLTCGLTPALNAYVEGQVFWLEMAGAKNTGPVTLNIDSKGAGAITWPDTTALADGDLPATGYFPVIVKDAVTPIFHLLAPPPVAKYVTPATLATAISVGDGKYHFAAAAPANWLICDGGTIGSVASSATSRANADTETLFTKLWNESANTDLIIQDNAGAPTTRGANAAADFAANKRMPLPDVATDGLFLRPKMSGRAIGSVQTDAMQGHIHSVGTLVDIGGAYGVSGGPLSINQVTRSTGSPTTDGTNGTPRTATETRPKNMAWLFVICYKVG